MHLYQRHSSKTLSKICSNGLKLLSQLGTPKVRNVVSRYLMFLYLVGLQLKNHEIKHYFYNVVDPRQVHLYGPPVNATNDALWQQAVRENPDPSKCGTLSLSVACYF
jgi:hypothetical protein